MLLKQSLSCSQMGQAKPVYVPPKDLGKYSPHQSSLQQLPVDTKGPREGYDSFIYVTGLSQGFWMSIVMKVISDCPVKFMYQ